MSRTPAPIPPTRSAPEVAALLGVTRSYVVKLAKRLGVGVRIGRDWRFTEADVAALRGRPVRGASAARAQRPQET